MKKLLNTIYRELLKGFEKHINEWNEQDKSLPIKFSNKKDDTFENGFDKGYNEGIGYAMIKIVFLLDELNKVELKKEKI